MLRKLLFTLLVFLVIFIGTFVQAQGETPARLRIMQLSYLSSSSAIIDIYLDDDLVFENVSFPFVTDYIEVSSGEHTIMTTIVDQVEASASTVVMLESDHNYSIIVDGDYSQQVIFFVIDDSNVRSDVIGSAAIIVNLTEQSIDYLSVNEEQILNSIPSNDFGFLTLPETEFVIDGMIGDTAYSETFTPHANTDFLTVVRLMPTGEPQIIYHRSSPLTITEYLRSIHEGAQFAQVAKLITQTDLLDSLVDGSEYTLFLPVNVAVDRLATGMISDVTELDSFFASHVTKQNIPPYLLPQHPTLMTLADNTISLNFGQTDSGYWEIEGVPILWDVRLANGVIYGIDGVINVSQ